MDFEAIQAISYESLFREYNKSKKPINTAADPGSSSLKARTIATIKASAPVGIGIVNDTILVTHGDSSLPIVKLGVWVDKDAQVAPTYNESTQEVETMDFNKPDVISQRLLRDKAIIAMHCLRVTKPAGDLGKGIGPNREDHPLFRQVVHMWLNGEQITPEKLEMIESARERVTKYGRQIQRSVYYQQVIDNSMRHEMIQNVSTAYAEKANRELEEAIRGETYGGW